MTNKRDKGDGSLILSNANGWGGSESSIIEVGVGCNP